jgi:hypothetical protein
LLDLRRQGGRASKDNDQETRHPDDQQENPMRHRTTLRLQPLLAAAGSALVLIVAPARADDQKPSGDSTKPTFGSRTDKSDGSAAVTVGRRLPTEWETKVGADLRLAGPDSMVPSEAMASGTAPGPSSGVIWGTISVPSAAPLIFDKTSVEARLDAGNEQAKLGAALSRTVPIGDDLSVTWQNRYAVTQALAHQPPVSVSGETEPAATSSSIFSIDQSLGVTLRSSGTTLSASAGASSLDNQWHNKLRLEQKLLGPIKLTASISDPGSDTSTQSIAAGFKRTW